MNRGPTSPSFRRSRAIATIAALATLLATRTLHAACNLIPSASKSFRSTLGDTNRPFAAPGDFVEVGVSPARCAGASPGFGALPDDHVVTVIFTPPANGPRRVVFITTADCGSLAVTQKQAACEAVPTVGAGNVACVQAGFLNPSLNLAVVDRNGERRLSFRFPDTDALSAPDADDRTASGPATIAVTPAASPLPCGLATTTCASQAGLLACIDDLFAADGSCRAIPDPVFPHFTALPQPNDFQATCFKDSPCTALSPELRLAVDAAGNLLLPVHWSGVLIRQDDVPVPRLIRLTLKSPLPFGVPDAAFLGSFTPEGAPLPPIFEPQSDPSINDPDVVTLFGSADAAYTILRIARRNGRCAGGGNASSPCTADTDCPGSTCPTTCVGGSNPNAACASDAGCTGGGRCGALFADFRPFTAAGGPLPLPRQAIGRCLLPPQPSCAGPGDCPAPGDLCIGAGICQLEPHGPCAIDDDCPDQDDACVSYAFEATTAVPLESLAAGTEDLFAFTVNEAVGLSDDNDDGDSFDSVVTLRDRATGRSQLLGPPAGCTAVGSDAAGRAVVRISEPPFRYPAVESEGELVAFLESEAAEGHCDESTDVDRRDAIVRVFELGGGERTVSARVADTALVVNQRALAISNGLVFYRRPEIGPAPNVTTRESVGPLGVEADQGVWAFETPASIGLSPDGRYTVFLSGSTNLAADPNGGQIDAFIHDHLTGTTERMSVDPMGPMLGSGSAVNVAASGDGQLVAFGSLDPGMPGDNNFQGDAYLQDRLTNTTGRISVQPDGSEAGGGSSGQVSCNVLGMSPDGRYVLFASEFPNLVPDDTNDSFDLFVRDLDTETTERVSVKTAGGELPNNTFFGAMSADGRFVAFRSNTNTIVPNDTNFSADVFVHDRLTNTTERVSVTTGGANAPGHSGAPTSMGFSADGRFVVFGSDASLAPSDTNGTYDIYVRDRLNGTTELASVATGGVPLPTGAGAEGASISADGRFVAFAASDGANAVPNDTNGVLDVFVHDRQTGQTERVSVRAGGAQASGGDSHTPVLSADGSTVVFKSAATDLVTGDNLGFMDVFMRTLDVAAPGLDLFPDGAIDDTVLEVFDAAAQTAATLCPATEVAVAGGRAAFLRPESAAGSPACPGGSLNPDADTDTDDNVVQLWQSGGPVQSLGLAATAVALSASHIAALASEAGQGGSILNLDGDPDDQVVHVRAVGAPAWTNVGEAADTLAVCGTVVPFVTPEAAQNADRNGDLIHDDRVLQIWDTAGAGALHNTQRAAEEFVCGATLIAFRSPEAADGEDRNGDNLPDDDVLVVYDTTTGLVHESGQAVTPCRLPECDPRLPYRVLSRSVKFLTLEADQGGMDLNGDGDGADLVIQIFDVDTGLTTVTGTVRNGANPLAGGETGGGDTGTIYVSSGRCLEPVSTDPCTTNADCAAGTFCHPFPSPGPRCAREQGVCASQDDCPPAATCEAGGIVPASPDTDLDGVPDHLDNCPATAPGDQTDSDEDGVGDVCDVFTCGNGVKDAAEDCDGADAAACQGLCQADCTCCTAVSDPKAAVKVIAARDAGVLKIKLALPLGTYDGEPVSVRFTDTDSDPIASQNVGPLPTKGGSGRKWLFKTNDPGVQKMLLKDRSARTPGEFRLVAGTKDWFTAAAANQPAADSRVTVTFGSRCFGHVVTKRKD